MVLHWLCSGRVISSIFLNRLAVNLRQIVHIFNVTRFCIGITVLIVGIVFYILYRPPAYFITLLHLDTYVMSDRLFIGDIVYGSLPSFVHIVAFSMITSSIIGETPISDLIVCLVWLFIEVLFEFAQGYKSLVLTCLIYMSKLPFHDTMTTYIVYGTFDVNDLVALLLGSLITYYLMFITRKTIGAYYGHT
jgi:hypothetical protein